MIFPDVTDGGSQVRWAPSELCRWEKKGGSLQASWCENTSPTYGKGGGFNLADFNGTRRPWEAREASLESGYL